MSLVDDVFGSIPGPLIEQWGIAGVYIKQSLKKEYDPETGTFAQSSPSDARVSVRILPLNLKPQEVAGEVQLTDIKILIAGSSLGDYFPKTQDLIEYSQSGVKRTAKIIVPTSYRGSLPILHSVIARLS